MSKKFCCIKKKFESYIEWLFQGSPPMASLVDVAELINGCYNRGNNRRRRELLNLLLDFGAPPDGTRGSAVKVAFENRDSSSLSCLLGHGASLEGIERPFHDAFDVALQTGNTLATIVLSKVKMSPLLVGERMYDEVCFQFLQCIL